MDTKEKEDHLASFKAADLEALAQKAGLVTLAQCEGFKISFDILKGNFVVMDTKATHYEGASSTTAYETYSSLLVGK